MDALEHLARRKNFFTLFVLKFYVPNRHFLKFPSANTSYFGRSGQVCVNFQFVCVWKLPFWYHSGTRILLVCRTGRVLLGRLSARGKKLVRHFWPLPTPGYWQIAMPTIVWSQPRSFQRLWWGNVKTCSNKKQTGTKIKNKV